MYILLSFITVAVTVRVKQCQTIICIHNHRRTQLYILLYVFSWAAGFGLEDHFQAHFLLKAHVTGNKMYALQLKIIRSQRYNIACDTITYYGIPFTLEKCFFEKLKY